MNPITPAEQAKIDQLKKHKALIHPLLKQAFIDKEQANQVYHTKRLKYARLQSKYEAIDREIAIMEHEIKMRNKPKIVRKTIIKVVTKETAKKALDNLDPAVRAALLAEYLPK